MASILHRRRATIDTHVARAPARRRNIARLAAYGAIYRGAARWPDVAAGGHAAALYIWREIISPRRHRRPVVCLSCVTASKRPKGVARVVMIARSWRRGERPDGARMSHLLEIASSLNIVASGGNQYGVARECRALSSHRQPSCAI